MAPRLVETVDSVYIHFDADPEQVRLSDAVRTAARKLNEARIELDAERRRQPKDYCPFCDEQEESPTFRAFMDAQRELDGARKALHDYNQDRESYNAHVEGDGSAASNNDVEGEAH